MNTNAGFFRRIYSLVLTHSQALRVKTDGTFSWQDVQLSPGYALSISAIVF
jgi:hypothetical protein